MSTSRRSSSGDLERELAQAREQQAATAEILRAISSSPSDPQPVFDTIVGKATGLCDAHLGGLGVYYGEGYEYVAQRGVTPEFVSRLFRGPFIPEEGTNLWRTLTERCSRPRSWRNMSRSV